MCPLPLLAAAVAASRTPRRLLGRGLAAAMSAAGRLKSVDYEVFGRVQGVCFRMYTEGEAKKIGVVGWVKNTSKGTVTGQVQGPEEKVNSIERHSERGNTNGEWEREKQTPCRAGSPMRDSILGLQDHDLSRRQSLNQLSHPGAHSLFISLLILL
ncbi:acylphosphatase-2 isoform X7 [Mirounga angustirostris]|uniref:acylphosphatase-2 isoform X7 n=1 Tax=Mirounga angustirostris TaxID=9716 RepID=UPI0023E3C792|nr:acylphosphatase-2 isoform X5 [Mirounga angustirostris]